MKKLRFFYFIICFFLFQLLSGQSLQYKFQAIYAGLNAAGRDFIQLQDSSYVIVGTASDSALYSTQIVLIKTTKKGDLLWHKQFRLFATSYLNGVSIQETSDNGFMIGCVHSTMTMENACLLRTDANGNFLWMKKVINSDAFSLNKTPDGMFIIAGTAYSGSGGADMQLIKMDESGTIIWAKKYGEGLADYGTYSKVDSDGNIYIVGLSGGSACYLIKLDPFGDIIWSRKYTFESALQSWSLDFFSNGDVAVGGVYDSVTSTFSDFHPFLFRVDRNGNFKWGRIYKGPWYVAESFSIKITKDDGIISDLEVEGWFVGGQQYGAFKTNGNGAVDWCKMYNFNGYGFPYAVMQTLDGGYAGVGSMPGGVCLVKTDADGNSACKDTSIYLVSYEKTPIITSGAIADSGCYHTPLSIIQIDYFAPDSIYCIDSTFYIYENEISESSFSIPNSFTPNNDGTNDVFYLTTIGIKEIKGIIYNRWGEKVAVLNDANSNWDGNCKNGTQASDGVYYYDIILKDIENKEYNERGFIHVFR